MGDMADWMYDQAFNESAYCDKHKIAYDPVWGCPECEDDVEGID